MTASASDAPLRPPGLRTRSGNAMSRTRAAILDAAADCVARSGVRRTTMGDLAAAGGVAKATLYNHFRTKEDVLAAVVEARVAALRAECEQLSPVDALTHAATTLSQLPALRRVAADEPALLVPLLTPGEGRGWDAAREAVSAVMGTSGAHVDVVLRWLLSHAVAPGEPDAVRESARVLADVVDASAQRASAVPSQGRSAGTAHVAGLGWPAEPDTLRTR